MKYTLFWVMLMVSPPFQGLIAQDATDSSLGKGRFGLVTGLNYMQVKNSQAPPIAFEMIQPIAYNVGLQFNWNQVESFSHRITASYQMWWMGYSFSGSSQNGPYRSESLEDGYGFFTLGYDLKYGFKQSGSKQFSLCLGPDISYNQWGIDFIEDSMNGTLRNEDIEVNYFEFTSTTFPLYIGFNIEANISINRRWLTWQFFGKYHYQFERSIYRTVAETIVGQRDPSMSYHTLTGNYLGVGIILQPNAHLINRYMEK